MMRKSIILLLGALIVSVASGWTQTPAVSKMEATVASGDSAYMQGEYARAIDEYNKVVSQKGVSSTLLYNMGNAYSKSGDYGRALLCYLRSLRIDPGNGNAKNNVKYIEEKVADNNRAELHGKKVSLEAESPSFFTSLKYFIVRDHTSNTWAVWAAAAFVLFVICLTLYIFAKIVILRKVGFFGAFVTFGICIITLIFSISASHAFKRSDDGVVLAYKVNLKTTPSQAGKENPVALCRGTRLWILDTTPKDGARPEWYKVRLNSDFVGWVEAGDFEPVNRNNEGSERPIENR